MNISLKIFQHNKKFVGEIIKYKNIFIMNITNAFIELKVSLIKNDNNNEENYMIKLYDTKIFIFYN